MELQAATTEPPEVRHRTGEIGLAQARHAFELLDGGAKWVQDGVGYEKRSHASHRAKTLVKFMSEVNPKAQLTSRTWQADDGKWYWAVRGGVGRKRK